MVFSGTVNSDFMKLSVIPDRKKQQYINFAGSDFYTIRQDMIGYVKAVYPNDFQNFSESDLGMMLIELIAYMGSVSSLKADMLANENYLRTVKTRNNLKKLLELIGVDLRGPIAAVGGARITATTTPVPANFPLTFSPDSRVFSVISQEDGAPVNYTLYKIENNVIKNLDSLATSIVIEGSETDSATSSVFTNLALLEGSLVTQKGVFNTLEGNKTISLTDSPIIDGSVQVYVDAGIGHPSTGKYTQVDRVYSASGATDKIFQATYSDDYALTLIFGDNYIGASPPPNSAFTVAYRVGGGSRGNLPSESVNALLSSNLGTVNALEFSVENRTPITGGAPAETAEHAKKYAPLTFRRQDRMVTLDDYIAFGNTFRSSQGTLGKTTAATRDAYSSANVIDVYTLERASDVKMQKASISFKKQLLEQLNAKKMITDEVVVVDGLIRTLDLIVTIRVDKELEDLKGSIEQETMDVILNYFDVDNTDFGKSFVAADLSKEIFKLSKVRFATIDNVDPIVDVDFHEIIQLNNFTIKTVIV